MLWTSCVGSSFLRAAPHTAIFSQIFFDIKLLLLTLLRRRAGGTRCLGLEDFTLTPWLNPVVCLNPRHGGPWPLGELCSIPDPAPRTQAGCMKLLLPCSVLAQRRVCKGSSRLCSSHLSQLHQGSQTSGGNISTGYCKPLKQLPIEAKYCSITILYGLKGIKKIYTRESILTNTSLKPSESHTAPVYVNPKDKGIFNFSRTINKPVKLIHLQGIIK